MSDFNSIQQIKKKSLQARLLDWHEEGEHIKKLLLDYDWEYRKKICSKCPIETQRKLKCFRVNNYKDDIQETHCKKMDNARSQKYRKTILKFIGFHPSRNSI